MPPRCPSFFEITNKANSFDENFSADGSKIPKENIPQTRIFEILYIMAGAYRLLGDFEKSNKFLEQIMFGGVSNAQGLVLWFIHQAKEMRQEKDISHFSSQPGDIPQEDDDGVEGDDAD
ncbi:hypothetical protein HYY75_06430 [bacterium]|nr:hypothetical protein [bacterium]